MENNFSSQGLLFSGWLPGVRWYLEEHDNLRYATGLPDAWLNQVMWSNFAADDVEHRVRELTSEYRTLRAPSSWALRGTQDHLDRTRRALLDLGWRFEGSFHGMVLELGHVPIDPGHGFCVYRVLTTEGINDWLVPFEKGFHLSALSTPFLREMYSRPVSIRSTVSELFVAYRDSVPITCGSIQTYFGLPVIYNLATIPEARGQGGATALLLEILKVLKERGETRVALFAEEGMHPLYCRFGFAKCDSLILTFSL